jgi:hypothetical protein
MAELVNVVRGLIGDPAGADEQFHYHDIQDALDRRRRLVRYEELIANPTIPVGGASTAAAHTQYRAYAGNWESDEVLYDSEYNALTVDTADRLTGRWTLAVGVLPPVTIVGASYDVWGAAADLLQAWAAADPTECYTSTDGMVTYSTGKADSRRDQATHYYARRGPVGSW